MIILASASPRRQELLKLITKDFAVMPSDITRVCQAILKPKKVPNTLL